jgi:hypothetical protein
MDQPLSEVLKSSPRNDFVTFYSVCRRCKKNHLVLIRERGEEIPPLCTWCWMDVAGCPLEPQPDSISDPPRWNKER